MIPVTLVTGFLGAGKTSLLAHLLDGTHGRPIGVVVNELAGTSIDAAYLHGGEHIDDTDTPLLRSIAGGRVGAGKLDALIDAIASLANEGPEAIVVETSGSSPVRRIVEALSGDPVLRDRVVLDSVVTLVDGSSFTAYWKDPQLRSLLTDQITNADLVVINKSDRTGFWTRRRIVRTLRRLNRHVEVGLAEYGRLPVEALVASGRRAGSAGGTAASGTPGAPGAAGPSPTGAPPAGPSRPTPEPGRGPEFQPLVARHLGEVRPFHPARLHAWLDADWPGVIRVKGFAWLATDMDHVYVVDAAADQREVGMEGTWYAALPEDERPGDPAVSRAVASGAWGDRRQSLVLIGTPDAVERELRSLRACLLSGPELDRGPAAWRNLPDPIRHQFVEDGATAGDQSR